MLTIRNQQMDVFLQTVTDEFVTRLADAFKETEGDTLVRFVNGSCALRDLPPDLLRALIRDGVNRARKYGLTYESSFSDFVALMFLSGPNFDQHPTIREALEDRSIHADLRMDHLWGWINDHTWNEIDLMYDPAAWNRDLVREEI